MGAKIIKSALGLIEIRRNLLCAMDLLKLCIDILFRVNAQERETRYLLSFTHLNSPIQREMLAKNGTLHGRLGEGISSQGRLVSDGRLTLGNNASSSK